jgi:hypothetical protein
MNAIICNLVYLFTAIWGRHLKLSISWRNDKYSNPKHIFMFFRIPVLTQRIKIAELTRLHRSPYWVPHRLITFEPTLPPSSKRFQSHGKYWRRKTVRSLTRFHNGRLQTNPRRSKTPSIITPTDHRSHLYMICVYHWLICILCDSTYTHSRIRRIMLSPWRLGGSANKTHFCPDHKDHHTQHQKMYASQITAYQINSSQDRILSSFG